MIHLTCLSTTGSWPFCLEIALPGSVSTALPVPPHCHSWLWLVAPDTQTQAGHCGIPAGSLCCEGCNGTEAAMQDNTSKPAPFLPHG